MSSGKVATRCFICNRKFYKEYLTESSHVLEDWCHTFFRYYSLLELREFPGFTIDNEFPFCRICKSSVLTVNQFHAQIQDIKLSLKRLMTDVTAKIIASNTNDIRLPVLSKRSRMMSPSGWSTEEKVAELRRLTLLRYVPCVAVRRLSPPKGLAPPAPRKRGRPRKKVIVGRGKNLSKGKMNGSVEDIVVKVEPEANTLALERGSIVGVEDDSTEGQVDESFPKNCKRHAENPSLPVRMAGNKSILHHHGYLKELNMEEGVNKTYDSDSSSLYVNSPHTIKFDPESSDEAMIIPDEDETNDAPLVKSEDLGSELQDSQNDRSPEECDQTDGDEQLPQRCTVWVGLACKVCGVSFPSTFLLREHGYSHSEEARFKCNDCDEKFRSRTAYILHRRCSHRNETSAPTTMIKSA